ncbi:hypothetical protein CR194_15125 [Salipaludibacillus keqinensis]|uniref:PurM-like N-terminal domain-containing protein n=1 Tax=Salipaludibacillus keqinensis TaxID=2045207 RepID=A0A323THR8_9BACI|nr:AIR synthase related protein [Salipaludibacillus keqinensis]PYZ92173.1 hypothetical protein CR194_15125 [Salipaludibacillus keqinensis]
MYIDEPVKFMRKERDLTLIEMNPKQYLVIACDSDGGIGNKLQDTVNVSEETIAQFAVRVPLFEIIACGAKPFMVIDCLSVEMDPTGKKILSEIKRYVREAGITEDVQFNGSTEENVPTVQTGIGITVLGMVDKQHLSIGSSQLGDEVLCIGNPKSGPEHDIYTGDPEIVSLKDLLKLRKNHRVRDILPAGSKGVRYEAEQISQSTELDFVQNRETSIDFMQSAGPSTCVLVTTSKKSIKEITEQVQAPVHRIGELLKRS